MLSEAARRVNGTLLLTTHERRGSQMADTLLSVKTCSINGCQGKFYARGWCLSHYNRNYRNGHPLAGRPTGFGEVRRWLEEVALTFDSDDCLIFPTAERATATVRLLWVGRARVPTYLLLSASSAQSQTQPTNAAIAAATAISVV